MGQHHSQTLNNVRQREIVLRAAEKPEYDSLSRKKASKIEISFDTQALPVQDSTKCSIADEDGAQSNYKSLKTPEK